MSADRRNFLKAMTSLPLALCLRRRSEDAPASRPPARRFLLNRFSIAGFQYYQGPALVHRLRPWQEMSVTLGYDSGSEQEFVYRPVKGVNAHRFRPGCPLILKAEPQNPHDPFAVEIYFKKIKLGYIPRSDNKHIHRLLQQGATLECHVFEVDPDAGVWNMVRVEVAMWYRCEKRSM